MGSNEDRAPRPSNPERSEEGKDFITHLSWFIYVNVALILINVMSDPHELWFQWVTVFWGMGLAAHGLSLWLGGGDSVRTDRRDARAMRRQDWAEAQPMSEPAPEPAPAPAAEPAPNVSDEVRAIIAEGVTLIDQMRHDARSIPGAEPRREALAACAASDQVLAALEDHPDEVHLARDFVASFLTPGATVVRDYARLARRDIPSGRELVRQVEEHDLPAMTRRANAVYDRIHRGTLIDLEVAREMMALDSPDLSITRFTASVDDEEPS